MNSREKLKYYRELKRHYESLKRHKDRLVEEGKAYEEIGDTYKDYQTGIGKSHVVIGKIQSEAYKRDIDEIYKTLCEMDTLFEECEEFIKSKPIEEQEILQQYYLMGRTWADMADDYNLERSTIRKRAEKILKKYEKSFDNSPNSSK